MTRPSVSAADRERMQRQARALAEHINDDEGGPEWAAAVEQWDAKVGPIAPEPWWHSKTEPKLHERARALGLLD